MNRVGVLVLGASLLAGVAVEAHAGGPPRADRWWGGLDVPAASVDARGVQVVKLPPRGRVRVPGGHFIMGSTPAEMLRAIELCRREVLRSSCESVTLQASFRAEGIAHDVTLSPFFVDRTEVTVETYERCVSAGVCAAPGFTPGDKRVDRPLYPVTNVRWNDAATFCRWAGGRLPTEAEWEYAARGPTSRTYPWGDVYNTHLSNHGSLALDDTDATDGFVGLAPVGSFPDGATPLGILDMAGNVSEWVADFYDLDDDGYGYPAASQLNPRGRNHGAFHVRRGGSFVDPAPWIRSASRGSPFVNPDLSSVGFRCAADAPS